MNPSSIPNLITILRIILVAPIVWSILHQYYLAAFILFLCAGLSDAIDGFIAKRFGWVSHIGAIMDPLADKLLLIAAYLALAELDLVPLWLVYIIIGRDLVILFGAALYYHFITKAEAEPTIISKINTLVQILLVLVILAANSIFNVSLDWLNSLIYTVMATTLLSGSEYVWVWGWRAWNYKKGTGRFP